MIRFIDLRGQINEETDDANEPLPIEQQKPHFAFFDTIVFRFVQCDGTQVWDNRREFADDFRQQQAYRSIERFTSKLPAWVPIQPRGE